ncbi:hypothetical protein GW17_00054086 [Ensete ventricosum]|nr:hypothetical protein GW17_00054086 [Ensete ventricosum]
MFSLSSNEERNFRDCSPSKSSSLMDDRSSKALEAMLREHDKDSVIIESSLPKIRATYRIPDDFDLHILEARQRPFDPFLNGFSLSVDALEVELKDEIGPVVITATKAQASEVTAKLDEAQRGEAEALEKVKALEEELQGMRGDLEAAQAKTREMKKFLSLVEVAIEPLLRGPLFVVFYLERREDYLRRCVVPSGCQTPHDDIDILLNEPLRLQGWVSRPPDIALEVPTTDELLYLITEVVAIFYVTVVIPMELIVLHSVLQLSGTLQMVRRPQQLLLLGLKEDFYLSGV